MKSEEMSRAMGLIEDELIESADKSRKKSKSNPKRIVKWIALAACLVLLFSSVFGKISITKVYAISEADYPDVASKPGLAAQILEALTNISFTQDETWREERKERKEKLEIYADSLEQFTSTTMSKFLSNAQQNNCVYSPLNAYIAMGMLAELTDGNSRQQILHIMGANDIEEVRRKASALWEANYYDDGESTSILANSLWLSNEINYEKATLDTLADTYYASSYHGKMGSDLFNQALQSWLNEQTGGMLKNQTEKVYLQKDTILALASTIYFQGKWDEEFQKSDTKPNIFHGIDKDILCDFMNGAFKGEYYWSEQFAGIQLDFQGNGTMWLFLPDEGVGMNALISDENVRNILFHRNDWTDKSYVNIHLSMPKFDVVSNLDLIQGLKELGVTDVFDWTISDFTPLTKDERVLEEGVYVSKANQATRVIVDEEGCRATSYVQISLEAGAAAPPDEDVYFVLDRPFLFVITGEDEMPLFIGVVNSPV